MDFFYVYSDYSTDDYIEPCRTYFCLPQMILQTAIAISSLEGQSV